jgi:hypothetical protein
MEISNGKLRKSETIRYMTATFLPLWRTPENELETMKTETHLASRACSRTFYAIEDSARDIPVS